MPYTSDNPPAVGDVVYYVTSNTYGGKRVDFGTVEGVYMDGVTVQTYERPDTRAINGIPVKEFVTPTRWQKLPNGWTYSTELFQIEHLHEDNDDAGRIIRCDMTKKEDILRAIDNGVLVKTQWNDHALFESVIDKNKGWRIERRYDKYSDPPSFRHIEYYKTYPTFDEADAVVKAYDAELKRQSEMTDEEWSAEQIDETLNVWQRIYSIPEDIKQKYRDRLLSMPELADIEIRIYGGDIQFKNWKNRRWLNFAD